MNSVSFMIPLPIAAFIMFVGGAIYYIYTFRKVTSKIALNKGTSIHQAYRNYFLLGAVGFLPSYPPLDPDREMEGLAKNWVVKLYSRKKANLMYARILDCIDRHRFMLNSMSTSEEFSKDKHFNRSFLNNLKLYFFLIDILRLENKRRTAEYDHFDSDNQYLYDDYKGYFKEFTTLSFKPETLQTHQ